MATIVTLNSSGIPTNGSVEGNTTEPSYIKLIPDIDEYIDIANSVKAAIKRTYSPEDLKECINLIRSEEKKDLYVGIVGLRKILSIEVNPPIQEVIDTGIVPKLKDLLINDKEPSLQFESAWCLTNIASGNSSHTKTVVEDRGVQLFVRLLSSPHWDIVDQAVWALGNIAGDSVEYRDLIIEKEGVKAVLEVYSRLKTVPGPPITKKRNLVWTASNICRGKPNPPYAKVADVMTLFEDVYKNETDLEMLIDASWGLIYIIEASDTEKSGGFDKFIGMQLTPTLIKLVDGPQNVAVPCLRILGDLASADNNIYIEELLKQPEFFPTLIKQFKKTSKALKKESLWLISNIAAGTPGQVTRILQHPSLIDEIFALAQKDSSIEVLHEIVYIFSNLIESQPYEQIMTLKGKGLLLFFNKVLTGDIPPKTILPLLEGIENMLEKSEGHSSVQKDILKKEIEEVGLLATIEDLQSHENNEVCDRTASIIESHFGGEGEGDESEEDCAGSGDEPGSSSGANN